jgi:hypothetical protein
MANPIPGYDGYRPEPPYNTDSDAIVMLQDELDTMTADRDRLADELAEAQREVRRAWGRAAKLWDGYDALKDFLDDESEDARDRSYSHLADHFQERVIEARQNLAKHPRPREDQLSLPPAGSP